LPHWVETSELLARARNFQTREIGVGGDARGADGRRASLMLRQGAVRLSDLIATWRALSAIAVAATAWPD
jgi:hypothetical protein